MGKIANLFRQTMAASMRCRAVKKIFAKLEKRISATFLFCRPKVPNRNILSTVFNEALLNRIILQPGICGKDGTGLDFSSLSRA